MCIGDGWEDERDADMKTQIYVCSYSAILGKWCIALICLPSNWMPVDVESDACSESNKCIAMKISSCYVIWAIFSSILYASS